MRYLVLKSNGLHRPKIRLKKFSFSLKIVPAYISKKLPSQRCPQPLFNFSHKRPTFAFTDESGYTLGFEKDCTQRLTRLIDDSLALQSDGKDLGIDWVQESYGIIYNKQPVSYTHLDVYKRQTQQCSKLCLNTLLTGFITPVS